MSTVSSLDVNVAKDPLASNAATAITSSYLAGQFTDLESFPAAATMMIPFETASKITIVNFLRRFLSSS